MTTKRLMKFFAVSAMLVLSLLFRAPAGELIPRNVLQKIQDATVMVCIEYGDAADSVVNWGSGMIIGPGLVVTNAHVVNEKAPTRVYIYNDRLPRTPVTILASRYDSNEFTPATAVEYIADTLMANAKIDDLKLSRQQTNYDMAVLSFAPPPGVYLPYLAFNQQPAPSEHIVAAGYPGQSSGAAQSYLPGNYGFAPTPYAPIVLSGGFITGVTTRDPQLIIHNARCSTGNSGGPIVNTRGEIVGMQTWTSIPGNANRYMSIGIGSRDIVAFLQQNGIRPMVAGYPQPRQNRQPAGDARPLVLGKAEAGDANYMALAGLLYFMGDRGFPKDDEGAAYYLQRAVRSAPYSPNLPLFKAGLAAVLFQSKKLWFPDYAEGLLRSANDDAAYGSSPDLHIMAYEAALRMQGKAFGINPDPDRSLQLAEKALEGGFALPFALAGYHYYFGDAYAGKDHAKALRYARQAASNDIPEGISLLAHLYYDSDVFPKSEANRNTAKRLAEEAANMGDPWAYGLLANIYYESGRWNEKVQALKMALLGTCHGNRLALFCLGRMAWDRFRSNPADLSQAARAWAFTDLAQQQGLRSASSSNILHSLPPEHQQRILSEAKQEQSTLLTRLPRMRRSF